MKHKEGHYVWIKYSAIMLEMNLELLENNFPIDISEIKPKKLN